MPSVGTRRSTRVFVRKNVTKVTPDGDPAARVLRSGKRLSLYKPVGNQVVGDGDGSSYEWMELFGSSGESEDADWWRGRRSGYMSRKGSKEGLKKCRYHAEEGLERGDVSLEDMPSKFLLQEDSGISFPNGKLFGIFYSRKRRRSHSGPHSRTNSSKNVWNSLFDGLGSLSSVSGDNVRQDRRYGIAFVRNNCKKLRLSFSDEGKPTSSEFLSNGLEITGAVREFAEKFLIPESDLWFGSTRPAALVLLINSARISSSDRFSSLLASILTGMITMGVSLAECASFLSSRSAVNLFSLNGIHFLPLQSWKPEFSHRMSRSDPRFCVIFASQMLAPLLSVNFSALPYLFKSWHFSIFLRLLYIPSSSARHHSELCSCGTAENSVEEYRFYESRLRADTSTSERKMASLGTPVAMDSAAIPVTREGRSRSTAVSEPAPRTGSGINAMKLRKRGRKRSFLRTGRVPGVSSRSLMKSRRSKFFDMQNGMLKVDVRVKVHPIHESREFEALSDKALDSPLTESGAEEYASPVSQKRRRFDAKNSIKRMKEPKTAFAEAKQNVDGLSCSTNILVIEADRCWREDGAKVVLELSSSSEWCIVVKLGDSTRFMHKAQEMKPSSSNRFTHATIWTGENGWKLEFYDKNDWNVFKELHKECIERNLQGIPTRIVPVPGVREVPGYEESCPSHFARPDSYIHVENDEVDRVLMSESASYDMDSGDEEWLERLNTSLSCGDVDRSSLISKDDFEKIISAFEKAAYSHPDDVSDQGAAAALCSQFGNLRTVGDVYDYWMKKRRQKHSALIRVFQGQPPRKRQPTQKPLLRKKRSFKRQGSHAGRGNLDIFFEAAAKQEAVQRFQAAEAATGRYVDAAVRLRSRAQELMMNADLAIYKAAMALRIAEEIKESASPDLSILSSPEASQGQ
ncbi:unnamed protein product [Spirodela intermedia]|uniref:Enhancer of polycomb-like protein n=1 Tax=Spirodela intermedia TaxID=51605 RepID=A0A7I8LM16_SPIIN|nr:unnamed protein product [Spirodela intermedia]